MSLHPSSRHATGQPAFTAPCGLAAFQSLPVSLLLSLPSSLHAECRMYPLVMSQGDMAQRSHSLWILGNNSDFRSPLLVSGSGQNAHSSQKVSEAHGMSENIHLVPLTCTKVSHVRVDDSQR